MFSRISQFRRPTRVLVALTVALLLACSSTLLAFAAVKLIQLSSDPFTNSASQHKTEVEPDTFAAGGTFVSAFQVGRIFGGGAADIGFATSTNGGTSFTNGFLPDTTTAVTPPGIYSAVSDASVAFDAKHGVWLISFLGLSPNGTNAVDVLVRIPMAILTTKTGRSAIIRPVVRSSATATPSSTTIRSPI